MTYDEALRAAAARLRPFSHTARLDAELLLAHLCGVTRTHLLAEWQTELTAAQQTHFDAVLARRAAGEPVAYLVGHKEFYGRVFAVDPRVLVPRPETELLIEHALRWAKQRETGQLSIADVGTGSGCIAITLALELPRATVLAVDLSDDALAVARSNVIGHGVAGRVTLLHHDGCDPLPAPVDLVATNPPYMTFDEVDPNVRRWEPELALAGNGPDGFALPGAILRSAARSLRAGGAVLMEIAPWQAQVAFEAARNMLPGGRVQIYRDLAGRERLLVVET